MSRTAVFRFTGPIQLHGLTQPQSRGLIIRSVKAEATRLAKRHKLPITVRFSKSQGIPIYTGVLIHNGQHVRGLAKSGRIGLHSGNGAFAYTGSPLRSAGLGRIVLHEFGHLIGLRHSGDVRDLMHSNVGLILTTSRPRFAAWFRGNEAESVESVHDCGSLVFVPE